MLIRTLTDAGGISAGLTFVCQFRRRPWAQADGKAGDGSEVPRNLTQPLRE